MLWLQSPQWARWGLAIVITAAAIWTEFRPDPSVEHPFAISPIGVGEPIGPTNTENRDIPSGLLEPVPDVGFATHGYEPGEPITTGGLSERPIVVPDGWWSIAVALPPGITVGSDVQLVLIDSGLVVPGRVTSVPYDDPLSSNEGSVAIPPESAAAVAAALLNGRVAVLVRTG